jgi:hypothetical protein
MWWGKVQTASVFFGLAVCTAATAQPIGRPRAIEATYSTNDALNRSVAHLAVASTDIRPQNAQLSQADLLSVMIVLSLSKKHP